MVRNAFPVPVTFTPHTPSSLFAPSNPGNCLAAIRLFILCLFSVLLTSCFENEREYQILPEDLTSLDGLSGVYQWGSPSKDNSISYAYIQAGADKQYTISKWTAFSDGTLSEPKGYTAAIVPLQPGQTQQYLILLSEIGKKAYFFGHLERVSNGYTFGVIHLEDKRIDRPSVQAALAKNGYALRRVTLGTFLSGSPSSSALKQLFSDREFRVVLDITPERLMNLASSQWKNIKIPPTVSAKFPSISAEEFPQLSNADQGDAQSQYALGQLYEQRASGPNDMAQARHWYEQAANQGHAQAADALGTLYYHGKGGLQDYAKARLWCGRAAHQGVAYSQYLLGWMYAYGQGVPVNYPIARQYYQKAAVQGILDAQYRLGELYSYGQGGPQDYVAAKQWYEKAATQGLASAQFDLAKLYKEGLGGPIDYAQARYWFRLAADQKHREAQYTLGTLYHNQDEGGQDFTQARYWLRAAADQGHVEAQFHLASMYALGEGGPVDQGQSIIWLKQAANNGHAVAQNNLGLAYVKGKGVPLDIELGLKWLRLSADQGFGPAKRALESVNR